MDSITALSPAKINLCLKIDTPAIPSRLAKNELRHTLTGEFLSIPLCDEITIERIANKKIQMAFTGPFATGVPNNSSNTIYQAAQKFFAATGCSQGVSIRVRKNIPHKSGLGGASSNAATTLHILQHLFASKAQKISPATWQEIALSLGSDVPFFFSQYTKAKVSGFGEICTAISNVPTARFLCLAMLPHIRIDTAWAYQELDSAKENFSQDKWNSVENDFEVPLFFRFPDLQYTVKILQICGAKKVGMSGSGSTLFAFFANKEQALLAQEKMEPQCAFWKILDISLGGLSVA